MLNRNAEDMSNPGILRGIVSAAAAFLIAIAVFAAVGFAGAYLNARGTGLTLIQLTAIAEAVSAAAVIPAAFILRRPLRSVFPVKRPNSRELWGSMCLFIGTLLIGMAVNYIQSVLMPEQTAKAAGSVAELVTSVSASGAVFFVCFMPAVCEEIIFRGVITAALRPLRREFLICMIAAIMFGVMHGDLPRMLPTALLGMGFTYMVLRTGSMLYGAIWHFANNLFSVLLTFWAAGTDAEAVAGIDMETIEPALREYSGQYIGWALILSGAAILLVYRGIRLLRNVEFANFTAAQKKRRRLIQTAAVLLICTGLVTAVYHLMSSLMNTAALL